MLNGHRILSHIDHRLLNWTESKPYRGRLCDREYEIVLQTTDLSNHDETSDLHPDRSLNHTPDHTTQKTSCVALDLLKITMSMERRVFFYPSVLIFEVSLQPTTKFQMWHLQFVITFLCHFVLIIPFLCFSPAIWGKGKEKKKSVSKTRLGLQTPP